MKASTYLHPRRIDVPPCPETGRHAAMMSVASRLLRGGMSEREAEDFITNDWLTRSPNPANEVSSTVRKAKMQCGERKGGVAPCRPRPPRPKPKKLQLARVEFGLADLWEASPVKFDDDSAHTERIIEGLFPHDSLLCVGHATNRFTTKPFSELKGRLGEYQFLVPSPMSKPEGVTQDGKTSARCLDNTGARRFAVIECDEATLDYQSSLLWYLKGKGAPLVLAVMSGGKSVHGWFWVHGEAEEEVERFYTYAIRLGACSGPKSRCQLVRMPDGTRRDAKTPANDGNRQAVVYYDPGVCR